MEGTISSVFKLTWPTLVIVLSIVIILRVTNLIRGERKRIVVHKEIFNLFFIAYILILFQLVTSQDVNGGGTNFIPFNEILRYKIGTVAFNKQVLGNILLFIPLGYFAANYCKLKKFTGITLVSLLVSGTIECVQHFIGRSFDVDDIILNIAGGLIGYFIYKCLNAIKKNLPNFLQKDWLYSIISICLFVALIIYVIKIV